MSWKRKSNSKVFIRADVYMTLRKQHTDWPLVRPDEQNVSHLSWFHYWALLEVTGQAEIQEVPHSNDWIRRYVYLYIIHYACLCSPIFYNEQELLSQSVKKKLLKRNFAHFALRFTDQTNYIKGYGQIFKNIYYYISIFLEKYFVLCFVLSARKITLLWIIGFKTK